jgi:photosystem II stability/assembly factor-like uncharacterized protein
MENINWICKAKTVNNNIIWMCHPKVKEHFEATTNTVQLFSAANYGGNSSSFGIGRYTSSQLDKIGPKALQSIKVPSGLVALLYQNADFTGYGKAITGDNSDLSKVTDTKNTGFNWSNQMQSLIVQPYVALPTSISDSMPKLSLVAADPNSFITAVSDAKLTRIDDKYYLYVDPKNPDNIFWYSAGDLQIIPPFSIGAISDLQLWFDARDPAANGSQPADGSKLSNWNDKSNNKFNTTNVNGNPIYNKNGVVFDGNSYYNLPDGSIPFNDSSYSIYVVGNITNSGGVPGMIGGGNVNGPTGAWLAITGHQNRNFETAWNGRNIQSGCPYNENQTFLHYSLYESGGQRSIGFNGTVCKTDTPSGPRVQPNNNNVLGWASQNIGKMIGSISEVLVFNTSHSDSQRQMIEGYLAWKWGLQSNLPNNHPFKSTAPSGSTAFPKSLKTNFANVSALPSGNWMDGAVSADGKYIVAVNNNNNYVWMSKDSGNTWKNINNNAQSWAFVGINQDASFIIASANNGYGWWISTDMGGSWNKANVAAPTYPGNVFGSLDLSVMYICDQGSNAIWKSTDKGKNWNNCAKGKISGAWNMGCCSDDGSIVAVVSYQLNTPGFIYTSTDGGNNWTQRGFNGHWWAIACSSDGKIMSAITADGHFLVSKDTGQNWEQIPSPIRPYNRCLRVSGDGSTIILGGDSQIHITKDLGKTWKKTNYSGSNFAIAASKDFSVIVALNWNGPVSMISQ